MDLDSAMEQAAEKLETSTSDDGAAPVPDTAAGDPTSPPAAEPAPSTPETDTRTAEERARDDKGRFAEKGKQPAVKPSAAKGPAGAAPPAGQAQGTPAGVVPSPSAPAGEPVHPAIKPPASWTPAAREAFAKAPPEVQREVERREKDMNRALQESAQARQYAAQVRETLAPYEGLARANGMDTTKWVGSIAQTAAVLHMGAPQAKEQILAQLIQAYGIDPAGVARFLTGEAQPQAHQPPQPPQDVGRLVEQALQTRIQAATQERIQREADEFVATAPEFLNDVWQEMGLIRQAAANAGRNMTWAQAYDKACQMNEEVSTTLAQRKAAQAARAPQPVTGAARAAASSVRSRPAAAPAAQPKGIDAAMTRAAEQLGMK